MAFAYFMSMLMKYQSYVNNFFMMIYYMYDIMILKKKIRGWVVRYSLANIVFCSDIPLLKYDLVSDLPT